MDLEFLGKDSMRFMQTINFAQVGETPSPILPNGIGMPSQYFTMPYYK
jgi:hypothetical protein